MKAFPKPASIELGEPQKGMDLRDYFAAKAMQGFAADPDWQSGADKAAETAYRWADAMMKAREK
jgi:hypothetical protein